MAESASRKSPGEPEIRSVKVEIRTREGQSGEVVLRDGVAVGTTASVRRLLEGVTVVEPGSLDKLAPKDGERYLRALPPNLSGAYVAAVLVGP